MNVNGQIGTAALFAQIVWIACGLFLYLTMPGASLFSSSAAAFLIGGAFAAALVFGMPFYGLQRAISGEPIAETGIAPARRQNIASAWLLPIIEAILIFVAAQFVFDKVETFRAGVPLAYVQERDLFDGSLKSFSAANTLEEEAKPEREAGRIDPDTEAKVVAFMEDGVRRSRGVSDGFLSYLHPELPQPYRTQLVKGYELLVEGRRANDLAKQTEGNELVRTFYTEFLPSRVDAILERMGLRPQ
jgi:hypothetical protein